MRRVLIIIVFLIHGLTSIAQHSMSASGKKFLIHTQSNQLSEVTAMDQHHQLISESSLDTKLSVKSQPDAGYQMDFTPFHLSMYMSRMGKEQQMDSDSPSDQSNPELIPLLQILHKTQTVSLDKHFRPDSMVSHFLMNPLDGSSDDIVKYILPLEANSIRKGFQWTDSMVSKEGRLGIRYIIMNVSDATVEIHVIKEVAIQIDARQMKGFGTANRIYDRSAAVLLKESEEMDLVLHSEIDHAVGMPITMKIIRNTTVSPEK